MRDGGKGGRTGLGLDKTTRILSLYLSTTHAKIIVTSAFLLYTETSPSPIPPPPTVQLSHSLSVVERLTFDFIGPGECLKGSSRIKPQQKALTVD
jgi:hypothetical protein